jgi:lysophospholipase L1-like esterase
VKRAFAWSCVVVLALAACTSSDGSPSPEAVTQAVAAASPSPGVVTLEPLRLVALGDAYTAGTHTVAPKRDSWPAQLVAAMEHGDVRLRLVDNLADSGQTSEDVMRSQLPQLAALEPDVVTLQVGVNDIIARDISLDDYRRNVSAILDQLLLELAPGRIFLITTPDHTLTARGADWGSRESGHSDVMASNAILEEVASKRGVTVVDIGPVNRLVREDASLVIGEGPYPTAKQYAGWVELIGPEMRRALGTSEP